MTKVGARVESIALCEVLERVRTILVEESNCRGDNSLVVAADSADLIIPPEIAGDDPKKEMSHSTKAAV
uniref:Uncharacterized protein n=1 Tax=Trichuris muris TaxID=70415 RepID=A0A5S6QJL2_TRIMR